MQHFFVDAIQGMGAFPIREVLHGSDEEDQHEGEGEAESGNHAEEFRQREGIGSGCRSHRSL
jgi:hypothetical protein